MSAPVLAVAWLFGVGAVFPFFAGLRQLLEHRAVDAGRDLGYYATAREPYSRVFLPSWFSRTFGGAGFNRHLIHHWDPQLSYTRFSEMERFLKESQLGDFYRSRETTYLRAFRVLLQPLGGRR